MKSGLIIKLIEAHCAGSEDAFKKALDDLANDEERKGNVALSNSLRTAYSFDKKKQHFILFKPLIRNVFFCTECSAHAQRQRQCIGTFRGFTA
ncbi:hypothetical protein [Cohnella rhizosphaerae]|uniref:Uncharacterized protein n=1 Tax=Cohnella rhizosphaerae TaxID=1457232 RepID=A0A9X4KTM2_9BACL|nr:hypothetical protein [Cohnella rhizosphaerae]MDG0810293.1 hypothetical protein [Cohnella rhizosphaerae]